MLKSFSLVLFLGSSLALAETGVTQVGTSENVEAGKPKLVVNNTHISPAESVDHRTPAYSLPLDLFELRLNQKSISASRLLDRAVLAAVEVIRGKADDEKAVLLKTLDVTEAQLEAVMPFARLEYGGEPLTQSQYDQLVSNFGFTINDWFILRLARATRTLSALYAIDNQIYSQEQSAQLFAAIDSEIRSRTEFHLANSEQGHDKNFNGTRLARVKAIGRELNTLLWYLPEGFGDETKNLTVFTSVYLNQRPNLFLPKIKLLIDVANETRQDAARRSQLIGFLKVEILENFRVQLSRMGFDSDLAKIVVDFYLRNSDIKESRGFIRDIMAQGIRALRFEKASAGVREFTPWFAELVKPMADKDQLLSDMLRDMLKQEVKATDDSLSVFRPLRNSTGASTDDLKLYKEFLERWATSPYKYSNGQSADSLTMYFALAGPEALPEAISALSQVLRLPTYSMDVIQPFLQNSAGQLLRYFGSHQADSLLRTDGLRTIAIQYYKSEWCGRAHGFEDMLINELETFFKNETDVTQLIRELSAPVDGVLEFRGEQFDFFKRLEPLSRISTAAKAAFDQVFVDQTGAKVTVLLKENHITPDDKKQMVNGSSNFEFAAARLLNSAKNTLSKRDYNRLVIEIATNRYRTLEHAMSQLEAEKNIKKSKMSVFDRVLLESLKESGLRAIYDRQTGSSVFLRLIDCRAALKKDPT